MIIFIVAVVLSADETADIQADVKDVLNGKDKETVSSEDDIEADANVDVKKGNLNDDSN